MSYINKVINKINVHQLEKCTCYQIPRLFNVLCNFQWWFHLHKVVSENTITNNNENSTNYNTSINGYCVQDQNNFLSTTETTVTSIFY
jgi:hypothetical protein